MTMVEEYMRDAIINSIINDEAFMLMLLVAVLIFTVYITIEEEKLNWV